MMELIDAVLGGIDTTFFRVGVLVIAAVSLLVIGYVLLVKSSDVVFSNRRGNADGPGPS
jgi:hypothetical protein